MGWKRLPMKVRFTADQFSSLKQSFMSIASVPKAVIWDFVVSLSCAAFAGIG